MKPSSILQIGLIRSAIGALLLAGWAGCGQGEDSKITVYRIPKETRPESAAEQAAPNDAAPVAVNWTAPSGWEQKPPSGFRKGSYLVRGEDGKMADISIISFPEAAGGVMANVNRWRDQLKLAPISDVTKAGNPVSLGGHEMFVVDLVSDAANENDGSKTRILGGIFPAGAETWFFKIMGPDTLVESQREAFQQFLQSVRTSDTASAPMPPAIPTSANAGGNQTNAPTPPPIEPAQGAPLRYTLPAGWQEKPLTPMRVASLKATAPNGKETDISIVSLPGMAGGDLANVNRWRGQVQLAPIDEATLAKSAEHVSANGHDYLVVDLASEAPINGEKQRILAAILNENEHSWFIKMTGEDDAVGGQKSAFSDFLRGLKIP